jgi:hypothetical protein
MESILINIKFCIFKQNPNYKLIAIDIISNPIYFMNFTGDIEHLNMPFNIIFQIKSMFIVLVLSYSSL